MPYANCVTKDPVSLDDSFAVAEPRNFETRDASGMVIGAASSVMSAVGNGPETVALSFKFELVDEPKLNNYGSVFSKGKVCSLDASAPEFPVLACFEANVIVKSAETVAFANGMLQSGEQILVFVTPNVVKIGGRPQPAASGADISPIMHVFAIESADSFW